METSKTTQDRNIENLMGNLLRTGVLAAAVIVFTGAVVYLLSNGSLTPDYSKFKGEPADLKNLNGIITDLIRLNHRGIIMFGLLVLIITPIARVIFSLIAFILQKDYIYTAVSAVVLIILLLSFFNVI